MRENIYHKASGDMKQIAAKWGARQSAKHKRTLQALRVVVKHRALWVFVALALVFATPSFVSASCIASQQSCTSTYGVSQTHFGSGGQVCDPGVSGYSASYCASSSAGDLGIGNTTNGLGSGGYQSQAGSGLTTHREPFIEVTVNPAANPDLGVLHDDQASTTTATFIVQTYLAEGYQVQIAGQAPTSSEGHTFASMNDGSGGAATSSVGTEQFGINMIANSSNPNGGGAFGDDPVCSVDASDTTFCPSAATLKSDIATNYSQDGKYFYPSGPDYTDTLATTDYSTGKVTYTLSFVYNISAVTPADEYTYNGDIIVTSTY
jgi:hypothetical protein